jgi:archaeal type IV pilus assembly protein PilA
MNTKATFRNVDNGRRGVAPIIATLLMVAIAVVGGILIFVFAQGFFNTTSVAGPTIESVTLVGYDAREIVSSATVGLENYAGNVVNNTGAVTPANNQLAEDEEVAFYFRNTGSQDLVIASLEVAGNTMTFDGENEVDDGVPATGEYVIMEDAATETETLDIAIIPAGQDVTVIASMEASSPLKVGRSYPVEITTGNGATFKFDFIAGVQKG